MFLLRFGSLRGTTDAKIVSGGVSDEELAYAPRFVDRRADDLHVFANALGVDGVNVIDPPAHPHSPVVVTTGIGWRIRVARALTVPAQKDQWSLAFVTAVRPHAAKVAIP